MLSEPAASDRNAVVELFEPYMTADSYMVEFVDQMLADLDAQDAEAARNVGATTPAGAATSPR